MMGHPFARDVSRHPRSPLPVNRGMSRLVPPCRPGTPLTHRLDENSYAPLEELHLLKAGGPKGRVWSRQRVQINAPPIAERLTDVCHPTALAFDLASKLRYEGLAKTMVTHSLSLGSRCKPTPTVVNRWSITFEKCPDDTEKATRTEDQSGPCPMFSPSTE